MINKRYEKGMEVLREHLGVKADEYAQSIEKVAPLFAKINVECAYGDVYGSENSVLSAKTKELCALAALTVRGDSLPQLKLHIDAALRCGATKEEIVEVITLMILYGGFPTATNAIMVAKEVFEDKGLLT
ncbi:MAG: 4-carboxymuconolactone decarboxylase [Legionella sp.]|nr:MAG: 4-carboxymuconolactone decarboxylase [Legionella sp.]PJD97416.1 MAG: 4-carboxymuconolactone decarboxylase [Legionella sp.]